MVNVAEQDKYSLIEEKWILVEDDEGRIVSVSLRDIFDGSVRAVRLRGDSPTQDYAVLRLLLAIFWRAHHTEAIVEPGETFDFPEWFAETWDRLRRERRDEAAVHYLEKYAHRFNLFDPEQPFMQVAGLQPASNGKPKDDGQKSIFAIIPDVTEDSYFTMRSADMENCISYSEAARWLIYTHGYDFAGIKTGVLNDSREKGGKSYGSSIGWLGFTGGTVIHGSCILETLLLNTVIECLGNLEDRPFWERKPYGPDTRDKYGSSVVPNGCCDLSVWQSRRVSLIRADGAVKEVVISNGDGIPEAGANLFYDPMTPYRYSTNKSKAGLDVYYPLPYSAERTMWKSLEPLLVSVSASNYGSKNKPPKQPDTLSSLAWVVAEEDLEGLAEVLNLQLVSVVYGTQNAIVETTIEKSLSVALAVFLSSNEVLRDSILATAARTMKCAALLEKFAFNLMLAAGADDKINRPAYSDTLLAKLEPNFVEWLNRINRHTVKQMLDLELELARWGKNVKDVTLDIARDIVRGAGDKALIGSITGDAGHGRIVSAGTLYKNLTYDIDEIFG